MLGSGGHAKVLLDILLQQNRNILGYTDPNGPNALAPFSRLSWLGDDGAIDRYSPSDVVLVNGLGSTSRPGKRKEVYELFKRKGYHFLSVIHSSAIISSEVLLGEGVQIMAGAVIQPGTSIGQNTIINSRANVDHDCSIGDHVHIAPGAVLCGSVHVGNNVHVGAGATIINNLTIGSNSVIGAGAVVIRDVSDGKTVVGVPAKELEKR